MSILDRTPRLQPWFAVLLSGLSTALSVAASLFVSRFGATASVVAVGLSFAFGAIVTYATSYQPLIRSKRRSLSLLVEITLNRLVIVYRNEIADCRLRANVMVIDQDECWLPVSRATLSIEHTTEGYSEWERSLEYHPGEGTAGVAFREEKIAQYDSETRNYIEREMTVEQLVATEHVSSAVSIPIFPHGDPNRKPIGVLNPDSTESVENTKFYAESARIVLLKYASAVGVVLG